MDAPKLKAGAADVEGAPKPTDFPNRPVFWVWAGCPNKPPPVDPNVSETKIDRVSKYLQLLLFASLRQLTLTYSREFVVNTNKFIKLKKHFDLFM